MRENLVDEIYTKISMDQNLRIVTGMLPEVFILATTAEEGKFIIDGLTPLGKEQAKSLGTNISEIIKKIKYSSKDILILRPSFPASTQTATVVAEEFRKKGFHPHEEPKHELFFEKGVIVSQNGFNSLKQTIYRSMGIVVLVSDFYSVNRILQSINPTFCITEQYCGLFVINKGKVVDQNF